MSNPINTIIIAGAGAAGCFAALACKEISPHLRVILIDMNDHFLHKVSLSGGGRCNCTNVNLDKTNLPYYYPRGAKFLKPLFFRFDEHNTIEWFESRGCILKTEEDGRVFPKLNTSSAITRLLENELIKSHVECIRGQKIKSAVALEDGNGFQVILESNQNIICSQLCLTTGGTPESAGITIAKNFGHTIQEQIPSLFSFRVNDNLLQTIPGVSVPNVSISIIGSKIKECDSILITHSGISGPAVIKISSRAARFINTQNYTFSCRINWCPHYTLDMLYSILNTCRKNYPGKRICKYSAIQLPQRLWHVLVKSAGCSEELQWAHLSSYLREKIAQQLTRYICHIDGRTTNKDEFVTCGGISCSQINTATMESRIRSGLFFAGELLDIDGITGGYNLQAAWSTGWHAGQALAKI